MKLIDAYIAQTILRAAAVVAVAVAALSLVTTFIGEVDNIGQGDYGIAVVSTYVLLRIPEHLHTVMPVVALLGGLLGLGALAAGSELIVIRASGVSMSRLGWSVARAGLVLALLTVLLGEWLGPAATRTGDDWRDTARHGERAQAVDGNLWLRERDGIIRVQGILAHDVLAGVTVYRRGGAGGLDAVLRAESARYVDGQWQLRDVVETRFGDGAVQTGRHRRLAWPVDLQPEFLRLSVVQPEELSSPGLYRYIDYLDRNGVAADAYRLAFWRNLTTPVTVLVLTVLALPFAFGALRSAGAGQRLFVGGLAGLVFFIVNEIATAGSQVYGLPAWLAASWPTLLLALGTLYWLKHDS